MGLNLEATFVRIDELRLGKVVADDIFANTQYPIVYKNTKINYEILNVFKAFQIKMVPVFIDEIIELEEQLEDNTATQVIPLPKAPSFEVNYTEAIEQFKKEFKNWESGAKIDITRVRTLMMPLIERVLEERNYIYKLPDLSAPKDYMYHHCIATGLIAAVISQKLNLDRGLCIQIAIAATLSDSGMAKIPKRIRDKKDALTEMEFNEIRKHPIYSYQMVKDLTALKKEMKEAVLKHHERLDGSGYPIREKIMTGIHYSQIIAVADVFHAMTSERLYRAKQSQFKVAEMIKEEEFGKFDIKVVQALMDIVVDLPIGTKIELSNLELGEVMFINKYSPTRPLVKLTRTGEIIDLSSKRGLYISRVITNYY